MKSTAAKKNLSLRSVQPEKMLTEICLSPDAKKLVFLFKSGEGCAVPRSRIPHDDGSPVTHFEIFDHGCAAAVRLASGVTYDLPWDSIKHYARGGERQKSRTNIGERVKETRQRQGLSQLRLAQTAGLSRVHLSRIESNASEPGLNTLMKIADALGVPVAEMLRPAAGAMGD